MVKKAITPSKPITEGEIGKICELIAAKLRKSNLLSEFVQAVLKTRRGGELADNLVADLRRMVDAISDLITRCVTVNRSQTPQAALAATGRKQYTNDEVVANMPRGEGDEVEVVFFKLGRWINDDELEKEYEIRGLVPSDPYSLAAVNEDDPDFANKRPNGTHWKDSSGKWCFIAFNRWGDGRYVFVDRIDNKWPGYWWFAGRRK